MVWGGSALAQVYQDTLELPGKDTLFLTQDFLVPFSDTVQALGGRIIEREHYAINYDQGYLLFPHGAGADTILTVRYRRFRTILPQQIATRDYQQAIDTARPMINTIVPEKEARNQQIFWEETGGVRKSGSLSTGLNVGNNRNASLTSGLRLQLKGDLGDGLKIAGALTDENIPVQPDGTTQQISDFDRVFIRLSKAPYTVTIGDYELTRQQSRFGNYYRNVQGLQGAYETARTRLSLSGAVAKGRFHSNQFNGIDGVSGPYRLRGRNGESFFIVLAGSERVYLNGELMKRGEANDYVINYNTAELTFTAQHVITNITRIVVDFEYTDQTFNRSLLVAGVEHRALNDRLKIDFSYARDADNPNAPFDDPDLFNQVRDTLRQVGDAKGPVLTSGVFQVGFDEEQIRYAQRDTLVDGINYQYYERSTDPERAIFQVLFTRLGPGQGDYVRDFTDNATVFRWVAPDPGGISQGEFAPLRQWVLPRLLQVANLKASFDLNQHLQLYQETSLSSNDLNRLSSFDDADNRGLASVVGLRQTTRQIGDSLFLSFDLSQQYVEERYVNLDRVYQAEYNRVWNLESINQRQDEMITQGKMELDWRHELKFRAQGGYRFTGPGRRDFRQVYSLSSQLPRFIRGDLTYTRIQNDRDSLAEKRIWNRYEGNVFAPLGKWQPGVEIWIEDQVQRRQGNIQDSSFSFVDLKPYLRTVNLKRFSLDLSFNYRKDREWRGGELRDKSQAYTTYLQAIAQPIKSWRIRSTSSYRVLNVSDSLFREFGLQDSRVLSTNFQTSLIPANRLVVGNLLYEVSSEQLARQEVRFIEVAAGQGTHIWLDSLGNRDGIQDIDEFQIAINPLVADYIRVLVPTQDLEPSTRLGLSGNLRVSFRQVIKEGESWWRKTLRGLQLVSNLRMNQSKARNTALTSYFIDLRDPFADTTLLSASYNLRQDLFLFQSSPLGSLNLNYLDNQVKLFLSTGPELRTQQSLGMLGRLSLGGNLERSQSLEIEARRGQRSLDAGPSSIRNYQISFWEANPELNLQFGSRLRLSGGYSYQWRANQDSLQQVIAVTQSHRLIMQSRWNLKNFNNLNARLELAYLQEDGEAGSGAQFELRQGLQPGANAIIQVLSTFRLLKNVELSFTYDGRLSPLVPPVHTGRIQVRAFF